jgi:hypothetical protein
MFDKLKKWWNYDIGGNTLQPAQPIPEPPPPPKKSRAPRKPKVVASPPELSAKDKATAAGEPYVNVVSFEMNAKDIHTGDFTIDFNDKFVLNLIRAGYKIKDTDTDVDIVDRWFTQICRSIVLEQLEQVEADPVNRGADDVRPPAVKKNLGDGKVEIS